MPSPASVLYLNSSSGRYGADRQLVALATGLDPQRYAPLVVLPGEGELADDLRSAGVEVQVRPLAVLRRAGLSALLRLGRSYALHVGGQQRAECGGVLVAVRARERAGRRRHLIARERAVRVGAAAALS